MKKWGGEIYIHNFWFIKKMLVYTGNKAKIIKITNNINIDILRHYWLNIDNESNMWGEWMFEGNYSSDQILPERPLKENSSEMKYRVGDKIKIKPLWWFDELMNNSDREIFGNNFWFTMKMRLYAGCEAEITEITNNQDYDSRRHYWLDIDKEDHIWGEWMFEEKNNDDQFNTEIGPTKYTSEWYRSGMFKKERDMMVEWNKLQEDKEKKRELKISIVGKIFKYATMIIGVISIFTGIYKIINYGDGANLLMIGLLEIILPLGFGFLVDK
jgi:hypothetical protein